MLSHYNNACFVDTSFFYAILDQSDKQHLACKAVIDEARRQARSLVSTPLVIAETHALLLYRIGQHVATPWLRDIRLWVDVLPVSLEIEQQAIEIIQIYADQEFTFSDAVSFATIDAFKIPVALSVDKHFVIYRGNFLTVPLTVPELPPP